MELFHVTATEALPPGTHHVRMHFEYDGGGPAKGAMVHLLIDDREVGRGRVEHTQPLPFASDEPLEIGRDGGSPVTPDYSEAQFTGTVSWIEIEIPEDALDDDHEVSSEERLKAALVRE